MKRKLRVLISCVLMCILCCFTALAAEGGNQPQPLFPGQACLKSVVAYPAMTETGEYDKDVSTTLKGNMGQYGDFTLNAATAAAYRKGGYDAIRVEVTFDRGDADMYEIYAKGQLVDEGNFLGGYFPGIYETFTILVPVSNNHADWKIILYDREDADVHGLPLSGRVTIPQ